VEQPLPARQCRFHAEAGRSSSSLRSRSLTCVLNSRPSEGEVKAWASILQLSSKNSQSPDALARQEMPQPQFPFVY
jgi:hypothetical protein